MEQYNFRKKVRNRINKMCYNVINENWLQIEISLTSTQPKNIKKADP